jgi:hypothetical protein
VRESRTLIEAAEHHGRRASIAGRVSIVAGAIALCALIVRVVLAVTS